MDFKDKTAIVIGGGTGIGAATARLLVEAGANVMLSGRRGDVLSATAQDLDPQGQVTHVTAGDIGVSGIAERVVAEAVDRFGGVDVLVNAAGIFRPLPFAAHTPHDYDAYLDTILRGAFLAAQAVVAPMRARGGGSIVMVGSMWALQAVGATPSSAYSAAMAGRHALTHNLAIELAADHIRVNTVAPAIVRTPVYESFLPPEDIDGVLASFAPIHPLGRVGEAIDVARAIAFLASDDASWITGVVLPVDGGVMAGRAA